MNLGSLHVKLPDGREQVFPVDKPQLLIGRTPDNDLVIPHPTISRRHVRMFFEPDHVIIEDLGSTNGTHYADQQLDPLQPHSIEPQQDIYLGEVIIEYRPYSKSLDETPKSADQADSQQFDYHKEYQADKFISLLIKGPFEPITPGSTKNAIITVHNTFSSDKELLVRIFGLPSTWYTLDTEQFTLQSNGIIDITLSLHPPRLPEARAGIQDFKVTVYSSQFGRCASSKASLEILPYQNLRFKLEPEVSPDTFILIAENKSNIAVDYHLYPSEHHQHLTIEFTQSMIHMEAGQKVCIPILVTSLERRFLGQDEQTSFRIIAIPDSDITSKIEEIMGNLIIKPSVPIWSVPLSIMFLVGFLLIAIFAYPRMCFTVPLDLPFCPQFPPVVRVLSANSTQINLGETVTINWIVNHADSIEIIAPTLGLSVQVPERGSQEFILSQSTRFTLRARNETDTIEESIDVKVSAALPGIQHFSSNPNALVLGQAEYLVLSWSVLDTDTVHIENVSHEYLPAEGELIIPVPMTDTTYALVAQNEFGTTRQETSVYVISPGCYVSDMVNNDTLGLYAGPTSDHPLITILESGTSVEPIGRIATSDWLYVRASIHEGWLPTEFVSCIVGIHIFPFYPPEKIPTPPSE
jgi:pSer/pThr/pTyr-binding forkhead associated (FHA) protein